MNAKAASCPRDWLQKEGNCYGYFDAKLSWDAAEKRRWRWADESTYNYKSWQVNQPDNYRNNEHCGELTNYSDFKLWNDNFCGNPNAYICKYQL
ncbi:C-type lectin BpLec-like [Crotalus adamanteus]|uniref:C-type lectin BpLec-like n=1 Tax=Crotalus adamanteus TaxID=8729 RepID=A0AAW1B710_CROAD